MTDVFRDEQTEYARVDLAGCLEARQSEAR